MKNLSFVLANETKCEFFQERTVYKLGNNYLEGCWEMGEICPKTKSWPPSHKAKINFNPPSHNDNIKGNPPPPRP